MSSNQYLADALTLRQIFLQRYSAGQAKALAKHINRLRRDLTKHITTNYAAERAAILAKELDAMTNAALSAYGADLISNAEKLAVEEVAFTGQAIVSGTAMTSYVAPTINQVKASMTKAKMALVAGKKTNKVTINQMVDHFAFNKGKEVAQIIKDASVTGRTMQQVTKDVTSMVNGRTKHQASSVVRTVMNHTATVARAETYKENDDVIIGETFVATLDSRTSMSCASLDGNKYKVGEAPKPPLHYSCRSVITAIVNPKYNLGAEVTGDRASTDGPVDGNTTYGGWLKRQSHDAQNEVLGKERAKLFRSGKLSIGKFTDDSGHIYSLDDLERLNPTIFGNKR